ncbi:MAG: pyridoxine/pyridoxamine 5'-phosphate oxidase [Rhodoglobus sp.]
MSEPSIRDILRHLPPFAADLPDFDPDAAPADPLELFGSWLAEAVRVGAAQPHAMVLSTVGTVATPTARTLLLKDVTAEGFWFASVGDSPKGREIAANPSVALTFYWREQGRQVRVTGQASVGPRVVAELDFLARHPKARANVIAGRQSEPMPEEADVQRAVGAARELVAEHPETVPDDWNAYVVKPETVEFWQASRERDQVRLRYLRTAESWATAVLWP